MKTECKRILEEMEFTFAPVDLVVNKMSDEQRKKLIARYKSIKQENKRMRQHYLGG